MSSHSIVAIIILLISVSTCFGQANKGKAIKDDRQPVGSKLVERPIEPAKLSKLIEQADKIVVSESLMKDAKLLFTSSDKKDITQFRDALTIVAPEGWLHDMCFGSTAIRLYRGETELALITNHHGGAIRCSLWTSDALLRDPDKWLKWFDARKITGPREEFEEMIALEKRRETSEARWLAAMPNSIRRLYKRTFEEQFSSPFNRIEQSTRDLLHKALAREFPKISKRILALLTWYGSGDGPWSGYPVYETIAEELTTGQKFDNLPPDNKIELLEVGH